MHQLATSLGRAEQDLLRETEDERMAELSEDDLVDLHRRIRRARNKYVGIYRRAGSAKVAKKGGRGLAKEKNARNAARAEVFEDALARVSARLAELAAAEAETLKAARLAAANPPGTWPGSQEPPAEPAAEDASEDAAADGAAPATDAALAAPAKPRKAAAKKAPAKKAPAARSGKVADRTPKGPGREKRNASSRAMGARRQAKRDAR